MDLFTFAIYALSILASVVTAVIFRNHIRKRNLFVLIPYLIWVFVQEVTLHILYIFFGVASNAIVYNFYMPVTVVVFAWIYYSIPLMKPFRKLIAAMTIIYLAFLMLNYLFIESIYVTGTYSKIARGFVITFCAVLFLFRYFNVDDPAEEKFWHPLVWITAGVAIFYPVVTISLYAQPYLYEKDATIYGLKIYQLIPRIMSIFMYTCFSYAFYLCQKKNYN